MKITKETKKNYIVAKFQKEVLPSLELSKEDKSKLTEAINKNNVSKR